MAPSSRASLLLVAALVLASTPTASAEEAGQDVEADQAADALLSVVGDAARALGGAATFAGTSVASGTATAADGAGRFARLAGAVVAAVFTAMATAGTAAVAGLSSMASAIAAGAGAVVGFLSTAVVAVVDVLLGGIRAVASSPHATDPRVVGTVAGVGAAAGLGAYVWRALASGAPIVPLYSRLAKSELLDNPVRAKVFQYILDHPGANISEMAEALALGWGTTVYHLNKLHSNGMVSARDAGNQKCYFQNGGVYTPAEQRTVAALKNDKARDIIEFVRRNPHATQKDVASALTMSQALVSWHVKRLEGLGVLHKERSGRSTFLSVPDAVAPSMVAAAAAAAA